MNTAFEFSNSSYKKLYCGENCFSNALNTIIAEQQFKNIFFISTKSLVDTPHYQKIKQTVQPHLIGEFPKSQAHNPITVIKQAMQSIQTTSALDAIIAFGGGSVVDLAKAVAHELNPTKPAAIISLPTTLSGAEFNPSFVVTNNEGIKNPVMNTHTAPGWIILDPVLSQHTPGLMWASTGCKSFSDCIEAICSKKANIFTNQSAYSAIKLLNKYLLPSYEDPNNFEAKQNCLIAIAFSMPAAVNSSLGLITACRHQLGARFNIFHGVASTIMMPYVLKWNFDFAINQYAELASVLDLATKTDKKEIMADKFLQHIENLIIKLNLNKKLREFVKDKKSLEAVVKPIMASPFIHTNVRPVTSEQDIFDLLAAAW